MVKTFNISNFDYFIFDLTEFLILGCKDNGLKNQSLWQEFSLFRGKNKNSVCLGVKTRIQFA